MSSTNHDAIQLNVSWMTREKATALLAEAKRRLAIEEAIPESQGTDWLTASEAFEEVARRLPHCSMLDGATLRRRVRVTEVETTA